jgi:hypothetical protein
LKACSSSSFIFDHANAGFDMVLMASPEPVEPEPRYPPGANAPSGEPEAPEEPFVEPGDDEDEEEEQEQESEEE